MTPRTISGQAVLSGMRPHVKRAFAPTILAIEAEAIRPYVQALTEADQVLESLAGMNATSSGDPASCAGLVERAQAAHHLVASLLAQPDEG